MFGLFFLTIELRRVTLLFPVAMPPPEDPVLNRTWLPSSVVMPRFDIPPPRLPETLCVKVL